MKIISFVTQKGGAGKSTLVISLAVVAQTRRNRVLIIDTDPQGTTTEWQADRPEELTTPYLVSIEPNQLKEALAKARANNFDYVFIDTAGRDAPSAKIAIDASDFVVVPCRPAIGDMRASVSTVQAIKQLNRSFAFVLNQSPFQLKRANEARKSLQVLGAVCPIPIIARASYQDSQSEGLGVSEYEPDGKAHEEIKGLWRWIQSQIKKMEN